MGSEYPDAIDMFVPRSHVFIDAHPNFALVIHKTAGFHTAQEVAQFFATVPDERSSHFVIGPDGTVVQCVSLNDGAGANCCVEAGYNSFWDGAPGGAHSNLNLCTISIEHVDPAPDNSTPVSPAQAEASFQLVNWLVNRYGWDNNHIHSHQSIDPISRARCPGNYPWNELFQFLDTGGNMIGWPTGWSDDGTTLTAPNGHKVVQGFRLYIYNNPWNAADVPLEEEHAQDPVEQGYPSTNGTRQTFNYTMLAWTPQRGVYKVGLGNEFLYVYDKLNKI